MTKLTRNHFNHHHLRKDGHFIEYVKIFMDIQNSSKIGGSFHYAPDLPFIERHYTDEKGTFMKTRFSAIVDFHQIKDEIIIPQNVRIVWHLPAREYEYDVGSIESIYFK